MPEDMVGSKNIYFIIGKRGSNPCGEKVEVV